VIIVDTTVLIYAVGVDHPLREPCRNLLVAHAEGRVEVTTTVEVIQEFAHVRARRRSRADAGALARHFAEAFRLFVTRPEDLAAGLALFEQHATLGALDSVLAGGALNQGAEALVSADRAFAEVVGLLWIDPATRALDRLIGR